MRAGRLLRSTPFRLAVTFAALMVIAFLISGFVAFRFVRAELAHRQERIILRTFDVIANSNEANDPEELAESTGLHVSALPDRSEIYLLLDHHGAKLAGNVGPIDAPPGWSDRPGAALGLDPEFRYRLYKGRVPVGWLVVGASNAEAEELGEIARQAFAWASLVVIALAAAGGAALAARVRRRYDAVRETMDGVAQGRLDARIPQTGRGDDLDALAADVNAALDRLAALVEGMRQVSADIAHELRTPLNRLKMRIETAIQRHERGEPVGEELEAASAESDRISETFAALLRIAQIESGAGRSRFAPVALDEVLADVVEVYGDVAEDAGKTLTLDAAARGAVQGDRELLTQLFANLIENALVHCPDGARIVCALARRDDALVATVADDGPGIPEAERAKVLRRLYRLEKSRTSPGSGLGLSLVRAIAELHGARLALEDNRPGLRVEIAFPVAETR